MDTDGRVALITGASRGIGRAIALALAESGFDIAAVARPRAQAGDPNALEALVESVELRRRRCLAIEADVADVGGHEAIFEQVRSAFGRLDLFVSNAGIAPAQRLDVLDTTPASFDQVLGTNLRGAFFLAQKAARAMLDVRLMLPQCTPRIIFIGSVSAEASSPNRAEYCISKAGLSMAARVLADRLAPTGIPVFEIRPGIIRTDMTAPVQARYDSAIASGLVPQRRWGEPNDVARAVVALANGAFDYSTGLIVDVGGGMTLPRL
jgi:NAD(P)-dependent dehydrogenase (short-subunit alcohol dehydrogenase family)